MANKKVSELTAKTPAVTDVLPVADPSTGVAGKSTPAQLLVAGFNQAAVIQTASSIAYTPTTVNISSAANDLSIGTAGVVLANVTATVDLTGLSGSNTSGKVVFFVHVGTNALSVKNEDAASIAANRILTHNGGNLNLQAGHMLICIYDGTVSRWRVWNL
jgi:hypothetical protein